MNTNNNGFDYIFVFFFALGIIRIIAAIPMIFDWPVAIALYGIISILLSIIFAKASLEVENKKNK